MKTEFLFSVAAVLIEVKVLGLPSLTTALPERYFAFAGVQGSETIHVEMNLQLLQGEFKPGTDPGRPGVQTRDGIRILSRGDFNVEMSMGQGDVSAQGHIRDSIYSFDTMLRVLLSELLVEVGGILVHGCGLLVSEDSGVLFHGVSESGKSTLSLKAGMANTLTDEISIVRKTGQAWMLYGTPFWGDFVKAGQNLAVPLYCMAQFQPPRNRIVNESISAATMVFCLLRNLLNFDNAKHREQQLLSLLQDLCRSVPCIDFAFSLTEEWGDVCERLKI